ncbi:MAG: hypothetical protein AB7F37_11275 [Variibacter sp.]
MAEDAAVTDARNERHGAGNRISCGEAGESYSKCEAGFFTREDRSHDRRNREEGDDESCVRPKSETQSGDRAGKNGTRDQARSHLCEQSCADEKHASGDERCFRIVAQRRHHRKMQR